ncbi:hypothetical protein NUH87_31000 [Pseudomonas batumici]|uniref:hypothetical protein n=1 Tax=Pseudomonas batumici TaxID=226910 RepID=UPI0030CAC7E2
MSLQGTLIRVLYAPASYADAVWLGRFEGAERLSLTMRNRLLIRHLALETACAPIILEQAPVAEFLRLWARLPAVAYVCGLLALRSELMSSGYINRLCSQTTALLALPLSLPAATERPVDITRETITGYGARYVMALGQGLPLPLYQRLRLLFAPMSNQARWSVPASAQFAFQLAIDHVENHRVETGCQAVGCAG